MTITVGLLKRAIAELPDDLPLVRRDHFGYGLPYTTLPTVETVQMDAIRTSHRNPPRIQVLVLDAPSRGPEPD